MSSRRRGRPQKTNNTPSNEIVDLDLDDKLMLEYQIKDCSVKLTPINIEQSAMDDTSTATLPVAPKRRGRKPKNSLAAKPVETPTKTDASDDDKAADNKNESTANESMEKPDKPVKLSLSERKQAKKAAIEAIIASGGRGKRTPKPNPKYMDEPVVSASKLKDELDSENGEGDDGDDEMNLSSDDLPRNEGPLKKRMLQKIAGIKSGPGRKPGSGKGTPGRKPGSLVAIKRKIDVDIDIDDDHGKQLFLDAKRRLENSPSGSEDDAQLKKSKSPITDALAAKLRSKYPNDLTIKRTIAVNNKTPLVRARLLQNKIAKDGSFELRQRKFTEETETSEDDFGRGTSDQEPSSPKIINRRKTQHTKILSDEKIIRPSSSGTPATIVRKQIGGTVIVTKPINKSPLTQSQLIQSKLTSGAAAKTYSISSQSRIIGINKPAILRQPPRILNSTLCKPTNKVTVPSLVTKVVTKDDYENELNKKRNNNIISSRSKENNVTSYVYTEKDGKMVPKRPIVQASPQKLIQQRKTVLPVVRTPTTQQRIISEPVTTNIPNSKRIRKITCFETWYVIKMADEQPKVEKSILNMSLMQIGNEIKKIELPSSEWTYKILLQPLSKELLAMRESKTIEKAAKDDEQSSEERKENSETPSEKSDTDTKSDSKNIDKNSTRKKNEDNKESDFKDEDETPKDDESKAEEIDSAASTDEDAQEEKKDKDDKSEDAEKSEENKQKPKAEPKSENSADSASSEIDEKTEKSEDSESKASAKTETTIDCEVYTGEVHDPNINPDERKNYRPINIMFRRKCQNPNIRIQFDRTVILKNQTFYVNVDGKNVRLIASPQQIETFEDLATLLQIVNDVSLNSCYIELATHVG